MAQAGWVASALLGGQLASSFALPALGVAMIGRAAVVGLGALLALGLALSELALLAGWLLVGLCCGAFQYLGIVTAASHGQPRLAFALRLGVVLVLAGTVVSVLQARGTLVSYHALQLSLGAIFGLLLLIGIMLFRPIAEAPPTGTHQELPGWHHVCGLVAVFVLFVGQTGFLAYVLQGAGDRGMEVAEAVWAFAGIKALAGMVLLLWLLRHREHAEARLLELGLVLGLCVLVVSATDRVALFFIGLLLFEISFNTLSARSQARVVATGPVKRWLTGAILLGAALGPPLHGKSISAGAGAYFIAFAILSALVPKVWDVLLNRTRVVMSRSP